jgi:hypothetical protein
MSDSAEQWEFAFVIENLPAPTRDFRIGDSLLIRGINPEKRRAEGRVRLQAGTLSELSQAKQTARDLLHQFLRYYTLVGFGASGPPEVSSASLAVVDSRQPIGEAQSLSIELPEFDAAAAQIGHCEITLMHATELYETFETVFQREDLAYLQLALDYYQYASRTRRAEEILINNMIALEALYSTGEPGIRSRMARRAAAVLRVLQPEGFLPVIEDIKSLYESRSAVLHGGRPSPVDAMRLNHLEFFVAESLRILIPLCIRKSELIGLVDESFEKPDQASRLRSLVEHAVERWRAIAKRHRQL